MLLAFFQLGHHGAGLHRKVEDQPAIATKEPSSDSIFILIVSEHLDLDFEQYVIENFDQFCPKDGIYTYSLGNVNCSIHNEDSIDKLIVHSKEVPWL